MTVDDVSAGMSHELVAARTGRAYEVVAGYLRTRIVTSELQPGERLPTETELAEGFGVSRTTVREALRLLAAQDLIRTGTGATGGSYVTVPRIQHISEFLHSSINLLAVSDRISLDQLLEARRLLEVPAAGLAASRRREADIERLRALTEPEKVARQGQFEHNRGFHTIVVELSDNALLSIAAQPIFRILMQLFERFPLGARLSRMSERDHIQIADAIERGDSNASETLMEAHLELLRPHYERVWRRSRA